jgi:6-pyruvoyltetrahydropterin/6-carboxytetrahydropterin synthase
MSPSHEIFTEFGFEAAHRLPNVPPDHKCARLHGHSFRAEVHVRGDVDPALGWVVDFADIRAAAEPVRAALDHRYLNEIDGLDNPTSEVIAVWIWERIAPSLPRLSRVVVRETCTAAVVYEGPSAD